MPVNQEQHRLPYWVAQPYCLDGLPQRQIASRFGLSRPKVSRLTRLGDECGITGLECQLEQRYGLREAVIVPVSDPDNGSVVVRELVQLGSSDHAFD